jgi:predicted nuclease of predicted toxin-antitoxin system
VKPALIANENFPEPALGILREEGIDVLSVREYMPGATDEEVLAKAAETGRWLVTFDRDYGRLVFAGKCQPPPAIVYLRQEPIPPTRPAKWVLELLDSPDEVLGHLVVIGEQVIRKRPLPKVSA